MLLDWTSCGGGTSVAQSEKTRLQSSTGWVWIDRNGQTRYATSVGCSSKRQLEQVRLCKLRRVAQGAARVYHRRGFRCGGRCSDSTSSSAPLDDSRESDGYHIGEAVVRAWLEASWHPPTNAWAELFSVADALCRSLRHCHLCLTCYPKKGIFCGWTIRQTSRTRKRKNRRPNR